MNKNNNIIGKNWESTNSKMQESRKGGLVVLQNSRLKLDAILRDTGLLMSLLVAAVTKHLLTVAALKGSLLQVDCSLVAMEVRYMPKGLGTLVAVIQKGLRVRLDCTPSPLFLPIT
jgi:hypothetical protein